MKKPIKITAIAMALFLMLSASACGAKEAYNENTETPSDTQTDTAEQAVEKNGSVMILFTSDVHCGVDQGFGYAGLAQIRQSYENQGYTTILVDDGDSIQGEALGTLTKGDAMIELMNAVKYDAAIPGNHEFDYGTDRFIELSEKAEFPYISCNFNKEGELVFDPYTIIEAEGMRIAFVGVTTPTTIVTSSSSKSFMNERGEYVYGFMQEDNGQALYEAVQNAVDDARAEGVDYVYVLGHMGMEANAGPWTYADVISNTNGIDVLLDGHSHDTEQVVMKNKDGEDVVRSACGTKLNCIGYSLISPDNGIEETNILIWPNKNNVPEIFGIENEISRKIDEKMTALKETLNKVVSKSDVYLTINEPNQMDSNGNPIRMVRRAETNLGDFCADAIRNQSGADIGFANGGGIRAEITAGDITYENVINIYPYGNEICLIELTGQQILDALEWGSRLVPEESGAFLQVSGLSYEIDLSVESGCVADGSMMAGIEGERRVKNVMVGDEPIDPDKTYTLASSDFLLLGDGDGNTAFRGAKVLSDSIKLDNQVLIDYIEETLGGTIGDEYSDPYGQGRIVIIDE